METVLVENMNKTEPEDEKEKLDITDSAAEESKDLDLQRSEDVKKEDQLLTTDLTEDTACEEDPENRVKKKHYSQNNKHVISMSV